MSADNELFTIPQSDVMSVFSTPGALDPILARIRQEIDAFVPPPVDTAKGRAEIKAMAMTIVRSKVYLEDLGKALAAEVKKIPAAIDANRKKVRDTLDDWRDEVRAPVTKWEDAEELRISGHTRALAEIMSAAEITARPSVELRDLLAKIDATDVGPAWQEFQEDAARAKETAIAALQAAIVAREKHEAEQAELAALRQQAAERDARDREETMKREAADAARLKAERDAAAEIGRREAAARAGREAIEAKAKADQEAAERRERDLREQAERAQREAAETEARILREQESAKAAEEAETKRREADTAHRKRINNAAVGGFISAGLDEATAKLAVAAIAKKKIPGVSIAY